MLSNHYLDPFKSVKALGYSEPDMNQSVVLPNGCKVPCGKHMNHKFEKALHPHALNYNEYIVYDTSQIKMKYLVQVKFQHL